MDSHSTEDCLKRQNQHNQQNQQSRKRARDNGNDDDVFCYQCGEYGHMRNDCELKKRIDNMKNRRNGNGKGRAMLAIREQTQTLANRIAEMPENEG